MTKPAPDRRRFLLLSGAAALSGCGARGQFSVAQEPVSTARLQTLFVATSRTADPAPIAYGTGRARSLDFARLSISIPPTHRPGNIEWAAGPDADPARHFALVAADTLATMESLVQGVAHADAGRGEEAVLFVHGYNNNFAESIYRQAQIAWDYDLKGPQIQFAWPSAGDPLGYARDRDSVLIARDMLVGLILRLLQERQLRLSVVGHSMGAFLVMEALRQISLQGDGAAIGRLANVTLISPDIDIDLFRAQAETLDPLPRPFIIAVSRNDPLLRLSSRLARGQERLGSIEDLAQLEDLRVYIIDMTGLGEDGNGHFLPGTSAATIGLIRGMREIGPPPVENVVLGPVRIALGGLP